MYYWCKDGFELFDDIALDSPITSTNPEVGGGIGLTYTFQNISLNEDETKLSVNIVAESTEASYYSDGFLYVDYNSLGFGSNVFSNGTATFTPSDAVENSGEYEVFVMDSDENTLQIIFFSDTEANENTLIQLTPQPVVLGTLTFCIQECDEEMGLAFNEDTTDPNNHVHYTGTKPIPYETYSPVNIEDEENGKICDCPLPVITAFGPQTIHAGTGEILTITGENFGEFDPAICTVIFRDGDSQVNNANAIMRAGEKDFEWNGVIHWTDEEIQVKVPSVDRDELVKKPASSGKINVVNDCGKSEHSDNSLLIPYGILNYRSASFARPRLVTLKSINNNEGICFNLSSDLPSWVLLELNAALSDWCSETGINFFIGGTTNNNSIAIDNENVVSFTASGGGNGQIVVDPLFFSELCIIDNKPVHVFTEIDLGISFGGTNPTFAQLAQLRETFKHELGHAHMLTHAKNFSPDAGQYLMHPNGNLNGVIKASDSEGANLVFGNSALLADEGCATPIGSGQCGNNCSPNSTEYLNKEAHLQFEVSPNPSNGIIRLSFNEIQEEGTISVIDIEGKIIKSEQIKILNSDYELILPEEKGVYIIRFNSSDLSVHKKVLKL